jgi:hypothetical protein
MVDLLSWLILRLRQVVQSYLSKLELLIGPLFIYDYKHLIAGHIKQEVILNEPTVAASSA